MAFRESETIELKRIVVDDMKKEIVAFANCDGGKLYIGVEDDDTVIGLDDADQSVLQISIYDDRMDLYQSAVSCRG